MLLLGAFNLLLCPSKSFGRETQSSDCEREIVRVAQVTGVPIGILYAIGLTESGKGGKLQPFAMNVDGKGVFFKNRNKALSHFKLAQVQGAKFIDIGCMQINFRFHSSQFSKVEDMFDPRKNVEYAAKFLLELRHREGSWVMAAARYHAGAKNYAAHQRYVCSVLHRLVETGFGAWTPQARQLCGRSSA